MNVENEYLFKQVFSVVVLALLTVTFYMLAVSGLTNGLGSTIVPLLLLIIAIICLSIMSEVAKLNCILSKKK
mgnify:CR=1 FL=1